MLCNVLWKYCDFNSEPILNYATYGVFTTHVYIVTSFVPCNARQLCLRSSQITNRWW